MRLKRIVPGFGLYTMDFNRLSGKTPYYINISGIVSGVQKNKASAQDGTGMKQFKLHERQGRYVMCMTYGRHSDSTHLEEGATIIIYFARAQASRMANQHGSLWIYDDAHITSLGLKQSIPSSQQLVELNE